MKKAAFTLIELSIVLVIIGLIVGGVLVGRDLIAASEIRSTVSQIEKFNTAVHTFKLKYDALPGDMPPALAGQLGLFQIIFGAGVLPYHGDNNGKVEGGCCYEGLVFWRHLSEAGFVEGNYGRDSVNPINPNDHYVGVTADTSDVGLFLPQAKIGGSHFMADLVSWNDNNGVSSERGTGYYMLGVTELDTEGYTADRSIPPIQAQQIDIKSDDGMPNTGKIFSSGNAWTPAADSGSCTIGGTNYYGYDVQYNLDPTTGGNNKLCDIFIVQQ